MLVAMNLVSCHKREGYVYATSCTYFIDINFRDTLGNDLVAPLAKERWTSNPQKPNWQGEINPDRYSLKIVSQSGDIIANDRISGSMKGPSFFSAKYDSRYNLVNDDERGWYYLEQQLMLPAEIYVLQQKLVYTIVCPTIFGDDLSHELITYWDFSNEDINPPLKKEKFPECYGVVFDNQILVPVRRITGIRGTHYSHFVDIILGK